MYGLSHDPSKQFAKKNSGNSSLPVFGANKGQYPSGGREEIDSVTVWNVGHWEHVLDGLALVRDGCNPLCVL